ncbi:MAG: T9SS type A sorting domain-containing protein [Flavobacterium sp. JAD_PAG50586_2]|nr:MAG: T9SS type A sorting domain-containing protein [Flavobacterium sp. JAD_PAG50586_2]
MGWNISSGQSYNGTYSFAGTIGNVASMNYNGTAITNLTPSPIIKVGVTTSSSNGNSRASGWDTGSTDGGAAGGTVGLGKYFEFTITATGGKTITNPTITFGVGRSGTGTRRFQWRSSVDSYSSLIPVTTVNASITNTSGVLQTPDANAGYTGNTVSLTTSGQTSITFRFYAYGSESASGTGGLQGDLTFGGTLVSSSTPSLSIAVNGTPSTFTSTCVNSGTSSVVYKVSNTGTVAADGVQLALSGTHSSDYLITGFTNGSSIAAGADATFTVTFDPSLSGLRTASVDATSTTSGAGSPSSSLAATGIESVTQQATTNDATNVGGTAATLNGTIGTLGVCPSSTLRGFAYSKTFDDNDPNVGDANVTVSSVVAATGNFTLPLTGLPNGTEYSYRAYIYDGTTYTYGDIQTFTTTTPPVNDVCANPNSLTIGIPSTGQTLVEATPDFDDRNDVWYTFVPDCSGTHTVLVNFIEGEDLDFELYASACPTSISERLTFTTINGGFDFESGDFEATVGTTYYIRVLDAGGNSSLFDLTVSTAVTPSIALANTGTPATGNIAAGTNNIVLFGFTLSPSACNTSFVFTGANIATSGAAASTDLSNFRLVVDSANFGVADAGEIATPIGSATFTNGNPLTFTSLAQNLTGGVATHYLLIADVNSAADNGRTFTASLTNTDVDAGTVTGVALGNTQTITSTSILIADNAQVAAGNILRGTNNTIVSKAKLTIGGQTASITQIDFVTAGSAGAYVQSDIATNGFKLWRTTSSSILDTNTDLLIGSVSSTKGETASNSDALSFVTSESLAVGDYYYWLTVDVLSTATPSHTITVNGLTNTSLTAAGTTILGSTSTSGAQTIISPTLTIANNTQITTQDLFTGSLANVISKAQITPSVSNVDVTGVNFVTAGTYTNADIAANGFKLYVTTSNTFAATTPFGSGQSSATGNGETISFSANQTLTVGTTYYFWLTADVSAAATLGHVIIVNGLTTSSVATNTVGVFLTGSIATTGNQTIIDSAPSLGTTSASVDAPFSITLSPDNANYRAAINSVKIGATSLVFTTSTGNITLDPADPANTLLRTPGNKIIDIAAANYTAAQVTQTLTVGATAKLALGLPALAPPATNGSTFATQPTVLYRDKYDNPTTSSETITASKFDGGSWTLGGTTSITPGAATGSVTFTDLTATSGALVNNAQLVFSLPNVSGSTSVNSATFTIIAPDFISLAAFGTTVSENFDTLATTGTSSATPTGWLFFEAGGNTVYTAGTGSGTAGDTYSFGSAALPSDRAFGGLQSGSVTPTIGAKFKNTTGGSINSLTVNYLGEQWRLGTANRAIADKLDFQYSTDATSLTTGTWTNADALDFAGPFTTTPTGPLDGNATANRTTVTGTISGLTIPNGATFYIRYSSFDASGADDGLAVDNFNITPCQTPNAGINGTLTICAGTSPTTEELFAQLGGSPQPGGTWSDPVSGVYTYTVNSTAPCTEVATATVTVITQPAPNAGNDGVYTICSGTNITLAQLQAAITGEDAGGSWSPALGGTGTYTYTVNATSPCTTPDTSVVVVSAVSCQATQLSNCGSTSVLTSVNSRIFAANTVTQATLYRYRVAVSSAPSSYFYAETTYPSFRLTDVVGLTPAYGTTYNVEIQNEFLISGNTVTSAYGTLCSVTTQAVANITVATNQCSQTLAAVNSKIYINGVQGATMYTYRIAKQSAPTQYGYIETPYSNFRLTAPLTSGSVTIEHNTVYLVAVSVTTANGASNFNGECEITTPGGPMTTIQASQCGDDETPYQIPTKSTKVYATDYVSGATYTFRLEQYSGATLIDTNYATSPINYFDCNMFTGDDALLPNTSYHVYVAINYYGAGEFDHDCVVRTPTALKQEDNLITEFKAMAYPNPFANNFMIDVKSSSESSINLKVYDMIGRLIEQKEVRVSDLETTTLGDRYPSGVYNVVVSQENTIQTVRVVKR